VLMIKVDLISGYLGSGLVDDSVLWVDGLRESIVGWCLVFRHKLRHHIVVLRFLSHFKRSIMA
jgi:hypothetical protein